MLRDAFFLARKDVGFMLRQRETLLWAFLMPVVFFFFIGTITAGFGGTPSPDRKDPLALVGAEDGGFLLDQLLKRFEEQDYVIVRPDAAEKHARARRRLTVPAGFTARGLPVGLQIVGPRHRDDLVLQVSYAYEQIRPWKDKRPSLPRLLPG